MRLKRMDFKFNNYLLSSVFTSEKIQRLSTLYHQHQLDLKTDLLQKFTGLRQTCQEDTAGNLSLIHI